MRLGLRHSGSWRVAPPRPAVGCVRNCVPRVLDPPERATSTAAQVTSLAEPKCVAAMKASIQEPLQRIVSEVLAGRRALFACVLATSMVGGLLQLVLPVVAGLVADTLAARAAVGVLDLALLSGVLAAVSLLAAAIRFSAAGLGTRLGTEIGQTLRIKLHDTLLGADLSGVDALPPGEPSQLAAEEVDHIARVFSQALPFFAVHGTITLGAAACMLARDGWMAAAVFGPLAALGAAAPRFHRRATELFGESGSQLARLVARMTETVHGLRIIRALTSEADRAALLGTDARRLGHTEEQAGWAVAGYSSALAAATGSIIAAVWLAGGLRVAGSHGSWTIGDVVAFATLTALLYQPLSALAEVLAWVSRARAAAERIAFVLALSAATEPHVPTAALPQLPATLEVQGLRFAYQQGAEVLRGVDFVLEPGETVGLVGRSGSGKSTLVDLLLHLRVPTGGEIRVGGQPLQALDARAWRRSVGLVAQETVIFDTTVLENIRCGRGWISDEDVIEAARAAQAHEFILRLSQGYATRLGAGASRLSGGERQRLGIARALAPRPAFLILDEATSALDAATELAVLDEFDAAARGRSLLVISHRASALRRARRILLLDQGEITERCFAAHSVVDHESLARFLDSKSLVYV